MRNSEKTHGAGRLACAVFLAMLLGAGAFFGAPASQAWADVRKADVIAGTTVEDRGIPATMCPSIDAQHAYVVDESGTVYFGRDAIAPSQIASLTKIMTAIVALENGSSDMQITVSKAAAEVGESSAGLREGDVLTFGDAMKGLMIPSGNDAAIALAEAVGAALIVQAQQDGSALVGEDGSPLDAADPSDATEAFVAAMNDKAHELGCADTLFENPHGLDDGEWTGDLHSTASDVAKIVACAMGFDEFRSVVATEEAVIPVTRDGERVEITLESTDYLLGSFEGACGIKTGHTDAAGYCFAGAANRGDGDLYAIVLGSTSDAQRFADTETLLNWVYDNRVVYPLAHSAETATMDREGAQVEVPVVAHVSLGAWTDKTVKATFADPEAGVEVFALNGNVSQSFSFDDVPGAVKAGDVVGKATFFQDNEVIAEQDLVACEDVEAPGLLDSVGIWWSRFIGSFSGSAQRADSVVVNDTPLIYDKQATPSVASSLD